MSFLKELFKSKTKELSLDTSFNLSFLSTDIHSHLIPGVDDGARTLEKALDYIAALEKLGYKKLITTPHIKTSIYNNEEEDLTLRLEELKNAVKEQNINIEIQLAAEYLLDAGFVERIKRKKLLTFGNNYVLIECFHSQEPIQFLESVFELQLAGYNIVLAHPERYLYWDVNASIFDELKNKDVLFQLNILSLGGFYGPEIKKRSLQLLKDNKIELLGTDLHNNTYLQNIIDTCSQAEFRKIVTTHTFLNSEF